MKKMGQFVGLMLVVLPMLFGSKKEFVENRISSFDIKGQKSLLSNTNSSGLNYIFEENFDAAAKGGGLPDGWKFENSNPKCKNKIWSCYWSANNQNGFILYYPNFDDGWQRGIDFGRTITPYMNFTGITTAVFSFWQDFNYYTGNGVNIGLQYRIANSEWVNAWEVNAKSTINNIQVINIPTEALDSDSVQFAFFYDGEIDEINWWQFDNVQIYEPLKNEVFVLENNITSQVTQGTAITPEVTIQSFGTETNDFIMLCKVFRGETEIYQQATLVDTLALLDTKKITFPDFTVPDANAAYKFLFHSQYENYEGNYDSDADTSIGWVNSNTGTREYVIWEEFTNTGCAPCAIVNPGLKAAIGNYKDNKILPIFTHVNWPASNDPFYTPISSICNERILFYGVNSVPYAQVDGVINPSFGSDINTLVNNTVNNSFGIGVPFVMTYSAVFNTDGFNVEISVDMIGEVNFPGNVKLRVAAVEDGLKYYAPNGETNFKWVLRNYYPDLNGTEVNLSKGESETYYIEGSYDDKWDSKQVEIYAFIQNDNDKSILQAVKLGSYTSTDNDEKVAFEFSLNQNYPNPFNPTTQIAYSIPKTESISLNVFDIQGRKVRTLVNSKVTAGKYSVIWDAKNDMGKMMPAGLYFYKLQTSQNIQIRKMVLVK